MQPVESQRREFDLGSFLTVVARRRWIILGCFAVIVGAVGAGTWLQTPIYEATALLLVETTTPQYRGYEEMPLLTAALDVSRTRSVETHRCLITSPPVMQKTIASLGLNASVGQLGRRVNVETLRDTDVLRVTALDEGPEAAADIANAVATFYVEESQSYSRQAARSARDFLERQLEHVRAELQDAEDRLQEYKRKHAIADLDAETEATIEHLATTEALHAEAEADARAAEERAARTRAELERQPVTEDYTRIVQSNPVVVTLQQQLAELEIRRAGLLEDYAEQSPEVRAVDAQIDQAKGELGRQVGTILAQTEEHVNPVYQTLLTSSVQEGAGARGLRKREAALQRSVTTVAARLNGLPTMQAELARLTRAERVADSVYTLLLNKQHEVRLAESMQLANARVWHYAAAPEKPVRPRKVLNMALAVVFGTLVALLLAALVEYLDDTIKDPAEAKEALDAPLMGVVPMIRESGQRLLTQAPGRSAVAEALRLIRSNIGFAAVGEPIKTILVTSPGQQEGKSTTVVNVGLVMAQQGAKVILVDTDLRRPELHRMLGTDNEYGLSNVLLGEMSPEEAMRDPGIENVRLLPTGPRPPNPAELLASDRARELFKQLAQMADLVIFDSPPAAVVADAAILGAALDATLVVIEQNATRRPMAMACKERLGAARARLLGIILNKAVPGRGEHYYYYYYYYDYYGAEDEAAA